MARYVIDAPTSVEIAAGRIEPHPSHQLVAPNLIRSQASTLLLRRVAAGDLTEGDALDLLERVAELKMRVLNDRVSRRSAWRLAHEQGWRTTFDAEYVAVCRLQADALATVDDDFAARVAGLVTVVPVSALTSA